MVEEFATGMSALIRSVPQAHCAAAQKAFGDIFGMLLALRRKVQQLEARPQLKYSGTWKHNDEYAENSLVSHSGSLFIATIKSKGLRPGDGSAWKLCVKRGRDARDLRA